MTTVSHEHGNASTIPEWQTFRLLKWMKILQQSTWGLGILCAEYLEGMNNL
jgi:hypothetical protein